MSARTRFDRFVAVSELPIAFLAVLVAPTLVVEGHARTAAVRDLAHAVNWMIWLTFCGAYTVKAVLTPDRRRHARTLWLDLLIVVLSMPVPLTGPFEWAPARLVVLMRFLRGAAVAAIGLRMRSHILRPNRLHYAFVMTAAIVGLGALGIFSVEHGINPRIGSFGDAVWWSIVTATTVGYGDVSPVTPEGRFIAVGLMLLGIAFIGVFTATVSSFFFDQGRVGQVEERLARIEAKLDVLNAALRQRSVAGEEQL
ncbi:MAG TPA: ion channel [Vicinamibacterales bacterium]|nr:ion channel [Vicinamibacterales bacterium]